MSDQSSTDNASGDTMTDEDRAVAEDRVDDMNPVYRWTPAASEKRDRNSDCADEYAVTLRSSAISGIIIWGRFGTKWQANPWSARPLVRHLLERCGEIGPNAEHQARCQASPECSCSQED